MADGFVGIDLSELRRPEVIQPVDFEVVLADMIADLIARDPDFTALLESDPAYKVLEVAAYREVLLRQHVNDAAYSVMIAFASGGDLEHIGAVYGVKRRVVTEATATTPAVLEGDSEFRRRILLAPEAYAAAGPRGAYAFHALSADTRVRHADVWSPAPGEVIVAVQARDGDGQAPDDLVTAVSDHLNSDSIRPLTDNLAVRSVVNVPYAIEVEAFVMDGPDPDLVRSAVEESLEAMVLNRRTPSRDVPLSAIHAAAHVGSVDKVVIKSPVADVAMGRGEVGENTAINVTVTAYGG